MIGVIVESEARETVEEFFELFKTPWEYFDASHSYALVLTTGGFPSHVRADAVFIFSAIPTAWDERNKVTLVNVDGSKLLTAGEISFPLYTKAATFVDQSHSLAGIDGNAAAIRRVDSINGVPVWRLGFDIFAETRFLLSEGQPSESATIPTLDLHIQFLSRMILQAGIPVVQIPPVPQGHKFMACLTHDIDFLRLAQHRFDHTMWGFLYRALIKAPVGFLAGRIGFRRLLSNWIAALKLPFVHLGWADDFWFPFHRYQKVEAGRPSTFFLIPFKSRSGIAGPKLRATRYDVEEIADCVKLLEETGSEVAVHGIDAWHDPQKGREEMERIASAVGRAEGLGVRMHWLFWSSDSPNNLDAAGFDYDATSGYNEAVGWRAGVSQVFKPPASRSLLELPFQIQDTALFYPDRMNLTEPAAKSVCDRVIDHCQRSGGVLCTSWHDRSLVPERLWGEFYAMLLDDLSRAGAWFGTARKVVEWFRLRRRIRYKAVNRSGDRYSIRLGNGPNGANPGFFIRVDYPSEAGDILSVNVGIGSQEEVVIELPASRPLSEEETDMDCGALGPGSDEDSPCGKEAGLERAMEIGR